MFLGKATLPAFVEGRVREQGVVPFNRTGHNWLRTGQTAA
jgi:hypothetical protein